MTLLSHRVVGIRGVLDMNEPIPAAAHVFCGTLFGLYEVTQIPTVKEKGQMQSRRKVALGLQ